MTGPSYSVEQLKALQTSPLVKKPDGLPSILQWMDVPTDQTNMTHAANNNNGTARRTRPLRDGEGGAANEPRTDRPIINPMGQFGRRQSMRKSEAQGVVAAINALFAEPGDDTVLGPPKLSFTSASRGAKAVGEAKERTGVTSVDGDQLGDRFPRDKTNERWTRDREGDRARDKTFANGRRGIAREDGEGWTNVKGRKSVGQEDFERFGRNGDRNKEKAEGELENDGSLRRGNRERTEQRWGRREDAKEEANKPAVQGGWRDRDRERERERGGEREWNRGANKAEEDPEWMDTKVEKKESKPRTQDDFQRWKEQMRAKDTPAEARDEPRDMPTEKPTSIAITAPPMLTAPLHTPSTEPTQGVLFGNWSRDKGVDLASPEAVTPKPKPAQKSRFMTMFAKPEEPAAPSQPQAPLPVPSAPMPEPNADREGFQRILQMLGQVNVSGSPAPPPGLPTPANGNRHSGGISLDFHQQAPLPEPQNTRAPPPRNQEHQSILDSILAQRPSEPESRQPQQGRFSSMSPDNALHEQFRIPRPDSNRPEDHFAVQQPPSRANNPQDANLAAILNSRAREESQRDQEVKRRERDFLLTLMQQPSRATPPQLLHQNLPRHTPEPQNMPFFDQMGQRPQGQPKGRGGLPPGFMEDPRMFNENEMMRREAERREQELRQQLSMQQQQQQQEVMRAKNSRMSIGFSGHDESIMGIQRRTTGGDPRPMTNMGIPSQPVPDMSYMGGRGQPGMPPTPQERPNIAPPPGFGGPMRQPPGLGGLNQQPQMGPGGPVFSSGNTPLGHPPGFPPPGNMRGMGFPVGPGGNGMQGPPQGPPQGYFPPPGYGTGPPMSGMLRGEDPRMMFDGQFGGPGPRQQPGRPGPPPPNMY
ncbi:hypothetical protein P153DRAFT_290531 [Dothidotthia symphoricarpi CBS 119687]|uniref:Uncharacterized protein n=1 Tax=Dothidotthia symphoricarpi CBS 119687 TaxID=1392245 RepID=A0A6A6AER3_9PLEO|nr:uncharacterized protein P153DRAFT_290531 [Dothidotthia symphoricarpi CBS 119687]KAF2129417.1 hypothetical protein P153DRAFT_290531 [Dothidotthia symphoricarpi CBS 119687]